MRVDQLAEGQVGEISLGLGEWLREAAAQLERGFVLVFDYGHEAAELYGPRRLAGTLLGYRGHRLVHDPFEMIGLTDLTAHVDLTALRLIGERHVLRVVESATQAQWLLTTGLEAEWQELRAALQAKGEAAVPEYLAARSALIRLLDPRHLGRFRAVVLAK